MAKKKVTEEEKPAQVEMTAAETTPKKTTKKKAATPNVEPDSVTPEVVEVTPAPEVKLEDDVTVEKTADGVIEVKKHEDNQITAEEITIEQKLLSLYNLQQICTKIDDIRMIRGELPEEIRDNEDECEGKRTRIAKFNDEIHNLKLKISGENTKKEEAPSPRHHHYRRSPQLFFGIQIV